MNFLYDITSLCKGYMASAIADVTGRSYIEIRHYFDELETDRELQAHIREHTRPEHQDDLAEAWRKYGRRLGWYALVRTLKPRVVVETGVDKGLGACVLTAALKRNREEGHEGYYYGTDIDPAAGYLLAGEYRKFDEILYGDSIESLKQMAQPIDLLITDDDHSPEYEAKEYDCVAPILAPDAVLLDDNAHETDCLMGFARTTGRHFIFVPEKPARHWYPGAGIGIAFRRRPEQLEDVFAIDEIRVTERHGSPRADWILCLEGLSTNPVVYSLGVGEDVSFDFSVIDRLGATVHAFDPTPKSVQWIRKQPLPERFHFHVVGVSDREGDALFYPPENAAHMSHSLLGTNRGPGTPVRVPTKRLSTLMKELGHRSIDVLKMDIEVAEYAVIGDMLRSGLDVRQLLVEFHHRFRGVGIEQTRRTITLLKAQGYNLFAISARGEELSFRKSP